MQFKHSPGVAVLLAVMSIAGACAGAQTVNDVYTYTGANQFFVVPDGVTNLDVRLWGAGGGGFGSLSAPGGGGAYVWGILAVTPGEDLTVLVGGGGQGDGGFGGGGSGPAAGGGGRSGLLNVSLELVDAGAGGGGGFFGGGAGGVNTGAAGYGPAGGGGGTQSAGGAGGSDAGEDGTQFQGGSGGFGGGGGFFGGGAGDSAGGGGGSSYTTNTAFALTFGADGSFATPGNSSDPFYIAGIGDGTSTDGGNGEIVISYQTPGGTPEPGALALLLGAGTVMIAVRRIARRYGMAEGAMRRR